YLNLFAFSMLVLVLAGNYLFLFLGWEGVGLCSYLLISFWFERPSAARAGKKAFVTNRVGDFGFMLAMFLIFSHLGTLDILSALVAATIALVNFDIKRVLAYSTISQLGYMFLAVGVGAYTAAIFHMVTHAFFKALLFLGAGSVMHGMEDQQDMRVMGGLRKFMPVTAMTFVVAWLAIAGIVPFAG